MLRFCAASECIAGPSTVTAGYMGAEKGVERAHYLPPARGFGNMQPSRPQPRWQRSYLHVQCLVRPPSPPSPGERHKGGRGDLQGMAPSALAHSYQRAQCPAPRRLPRGCGSAVGSPPAPLWDTLREATKRTPSWVSMASRHCLKFTSPHHKSLQALACLQNPGEPEKRVLRLGRTNTSPCRGAEHGAACPGRSRGSHLPWPAGDPLS